MAAFLPKYRSRSATPFSFLKPNIGVFDNFMTTSTINRISSSSTTINGVKFSPRRLRSRNLLKRSSSSLTEDLLITKQHRGKTIRVKMKNILSPSDKLRYTTSASTQLKVNSNGKQIRSFMSKNRRKLSFNHQKRKNLTTQLSKAVDVSQTEPSTSIAVPVFNSRQKRKKRKFNVEKLRCSRRLQGQQPRSHSSSPESKDRLSGSVLNVEAQNILVRIIFFVFVIFFYFDKYKKIFSSKIVRTQVLIQIIMKKVY